MDAIDILGLVSILINYGMLFPLLIYYLHKYHTTNRYHTASLDGRNPIFRARDKTLIYMINILLLIILLIDRPLQILHRVWIVLNPSTLWILQIFAMSTISQLFFLLTVKVYHLYFEHQCNLYIADISWRKDLNPNDVNWYISHQSTLGNSMYLYKLCLIITLLFVALETIWQVLSFGETFLFVVVRATIIGSCLLFGTVSYFKVGSFEDVYCIKKEVFYQLLFMFSGLIGYIAVNIIFDNCFPGNPRQKWLFILFPVTYLLLVPMGMWCILYPLYICKRTGDSSHEHTETTILKSEGIDDLTTALSDYKWFKSFMKYLVSEFCTENLLFVVELFQIKREFQKRHRGKIYVPKTHTLDANLDSNEYIRVDFGRHIEYVVLFCRTCDGMLCFDVRRTATNNIILDHDDFWTQMKHLYTKYIKTGSDCELNISHETRTKLSNVFESMDAVQKESYSDLYSILDPCGVEMLYLLNDPFQRFLCAPNCIKPTVNYRSSNTYVSGNPVFRNAASIAHTN
eukprot:66834_1